jgi:hypothetical protein
MPMNPRLLWPRATGYTATDADARAYIADVEAADGSKLENKTRKAIDDFVKGLKSDSIWTPLTHCCILAGAKTLAGICVPLKGTAPTSNAFLAGDYNRKTGLKGSTANTKFLNTNVNNNTFAQDNFHLSVWATEPMTANSTQFYIGVGSSGTGASSLFGTVGSLQFRNQVSSSQASGASTDQTTGLIGATRSASGSFTMRWGANSGNSGSRTSQTPFSGNVHVFRDSNVSTLFTEARLAWYSLGANIDFALLRTRLTALYADLSAAIP